jgi:hypothetical protein
MTPRLCRAMSVVAAKVAEGRTLALVEASRGQSSWKTPANKPKRLVWLRQPVQLRPFGPIRRRYGTPNVAIRSIPQKNSTRFSSIFGSRSA